jgi:hypothetical protein
VIDVGDNREIAYQPGIQDVHYGVRPHFFGIRKRQPGLGSLRLTMP